jgi:HK97 family phage major capsid protein
MLKALLEKRAKRVADMAAIIKTAETEDRDLTAEEQTGFDAKKAEKLKLDARIDNAGFVEDANAELDAPRPAAARGGAIQRPRGPEAKKEFESAAEFLHAVRFNPSDQRLQYVEATRDDGGELQAASTMRMDNETTGGFMVPPTFLTEIRSVPPQEALVRPRAQVLGSGGGAPDASVMVPALDQTVASNNMYGGVAVNWIAEGGAKPQTDAKLRNVTLTPHEVAGYVEVTDKLLRNWQGSQSWIERLLRNAVTAAEDYAFLRGTGIGQPLGVINAGATKFINRAVSNQVSYADLINMESKLLMRGGAPIWSISQGVLPQLRTLTDPEGHYIWTDSAKLGIDGMLLGKEVRWNNRAPALGSKGDLVLADWSYYLIKDGSGPFVAASEHVKFLENKTVIKIFWNVDGAPWLTAPIAEENGYTVSPFVGLDVP